LIAVVAIPGESFQSRADAVGQDEDSLPLMRRADFNRAEYACRNPVMKAFQSLDAVSENARTVWHSRGEQSFDVFGEEHSRLHDGDSIGNDVEQPSLVIDRFSLSSDTDRLTWPTK
jgi:hypothetical protein